MVGINWKEAKVVWDFQPERGDAFYSSPAVADDLVVVGNRDKSVRALDARTGDVRWTFPTRRRVEGSPVVVGQRVFIGSQDGSLYALDLKSGAKLWEQPLGSAITASPAVGRNRLVIGTQEGILYCLGAQ